MPYNCKVDQDLLPERFYSEEVPEDEELHGNITKRHACIKLRFKCVCGRSWSSMKGMVTFNFRRESRTRRFVSAQIFLQSCRRCKMWCTPRYYDDEFDSVVKSVVDKFCNRPPCAVTKRQGNPRSAHRNDLCEACARGVCKRR
jgi:hypothetical protein